jgi:hypothetical protein
VTVKFADRLLRAYRARVALAYLPAGATSAFDIGCNDGWLLDHLPASVVRRDGCDPLAEEMSTSGRIVVRGYFPSVVAESALIGPYDAVFALATFEHFTSADLRESSHVIAAMLAPGGRLVATVPHPLVDKILHVLMLLRIVDGQEAHQHHGFDPRELPSELADLRIVRRRRFQLGLNYLYVFENRRTTPTDAGLA